MADSTFLAWLRATTETRWADTGLRDAATAGLGGPTWQPGTRWRGGMSESDLDIVEAMFSVHLPSAYRRFLRTLHTPDPPRAALVVRRGRLERVEERLFPDWTGATTPLLAAFEAPIDGLLRGVAVGRWHPAWGERPDDVRQRARVVRGLAAAAPRLIPFAGERYLVALPGRDDGPVLAVHGADVAMIAPDLRGGLLRELGLGEGSARPVDGAGSGDDDLAPASADVERVPFWSDVADGVPWRPPGVTARA
jgi:hypothetical protein